MVRLAAAVATICWLAGPAARAQLVEQTSTYEGAARTWYVHLPASYDGSKAVPLVIALHGVYNNATDFAASCEWIATSDRVGCIAVFPDGGLVYGGGEYGWNNWVFDGSAPDDVGFLLTLINRLKGEYRIDASRVYMTGFSNGGGMSNEFVGCAHAGVLAAIAPVAGGWMTAYGVAQANMKPDAPLPVWIARGSQDSAVTGGLSTFQQDQQQTDFWVNFNGDQPTPQTSTAGIYTQSVYTGGKAEVRYTLAAGYAHQYGPGFADKIWDEFFSRMTRTATGASAATDAVYPGFFTGEVALSNGFYYLAFPSGNPFGYYTFLTDPAYIFHSDLGDECVFDAADGKNGVYFYDFASSTFFYTSPVFPFPYLYDFSLNTFLYYYPDTSSAGHYTANPRYFYDFGTGTIISK